MKQVVFEAGHTCQDMSAVDSYLTGVFLDPLQHIKCALETGS